MADSSYAMPVSKNSAALQLSRNQYRDLALAVNRERAGYTVAARRLPML